MYIYKEDQIDNAISAVERDAGKLQDKVHAVGFAVLSFWARAKGKEDQVKAGEVACQRLNLLQNASPYHSKSFALWVAKYTPLVWNTDESIWVTHTANYQMMGKILNAARAEPFFKLKPASKATPYDDHSAFLKFADGVEAKVKVAAEKDNVTVHPAFVNKVRELRKYVESMAA